MFTLKLYRRGRSTISDAPPVPRASQLVTKIVTCHHVLIMEIGQHASDGGPHGKTKTVEIWAFSGLEPSNYETFYVGERTTSMTALDDDNHWDWGLLENAQGRTTEHFRPHSYG